MLETNQGLQKRGFYPTF